MKAPTNVGYTIYDTSKGYPAKIVRSGFCPVGSLKLMDLPKGEELLEKFYPHFGYIGQNGEYIDAPAPSSSIEDSKKAMVKAVQEHLDLVASQSGYDNIFTACTYAEEPTVQKFQKEGKALRAWRSLVWKKANDVLSDVLTNKRSAPTITQLLSELPTYTPPQ